MPPTILGTLGYCGDANGNRTEIRYPGDVTAVYTPDFADREASLTGKGATLLVRKQALTSVRSRRERMPPPTPIAGEEAG